MKNRICYLICFCTLICISCKERRKNKSDIDVIFNSDTLEVAYTYWWPKSGPFIGLCGDEMSFVFSGTITQIEASNNDPGPLYVSQKAFIAIEAVYKIKDLGENSYQNQKYFVSDCFNNLGYQIGDKVLVVCYDYEGALSIPGDKSALKIKSFESPFITSIKKYIDFDQNPLKIKRDISLWKQKGLGEALKTNIYCKTEEVSPKN